MADAASTSNAPGSRFRNLCRTSGVKFLCKARFSRRLKVDNISLSLTRWRWLCPVPMKQEDKGMFWRILPVLLVLPALTAADLPITEVTLYKHGVPHLERSGELKPGETARLDFKP